MPPAANDEALCIVLFEVRGTAPTPEMSTHVGTTSRIALSSVNHEEICTGRLRLALTDAHAYR